MRELDQSAHQDPHISLMLSALEHAACGIAVIDDQGTLVYVNSRYAEIYGYERNELTNTSFTRLVGPPDNEDPARVLEGFRRLDTKASGERRVIRRDGSWIDIHFTLEKVKSEMAVYTLVTVQDIGEMRHIRDAAAKTEEMRRLIMNAALDAIICIDRQNRVTFWNPQAEKIFGWPSREVLGRKLSDLIIPEEHREKHDRGLERYLETGQGRSINVLLELTAIRRDGSDFPIELTVLPIKQDNGEIFCAFIRDISERKRNEMILRELNLEMSRNIDELGKSNVELEQFAYIASHDLQEPLRMVTGFLTQLDKKYRDLLDEKGREYLHFAVDGAVRMRQIILDLLEYSRADNADAPLESIDLDHVLDELVRQNREPLEELGGRILRDPLPVVRARRVPITQVFQNLIGNAIKYHRPDEAPVITVSCADEGTHWKFSVTDNGIGIAPRHFRKIFVVFQRLHLREQYSGTGIGLAICKKIIEGYGGRIWVESDSGKGSVFYFTIRK